MTVEIAIENGAIGEQFDNEPDFDLDGPNVGFRYANPARKCTGYF